LTVDPPPPPLVLTPYMQRSAKSRRNPVLFPVWTHGTSDSIQAHSMEERGYNLRQRPLPVLISDQSLLPISTIPTALSSASSGSIQLPTMADPARSDSSVLNSTILFQLQYWPTMSSKINDIHVIWKLICDFLLVISSNVGPVVHRLATIHLWQIDRQTMTTTMDRRLIGCLHDPANVQQTSSKCIQNTRELLDVCWTFDGLCKHPNIEP